MYEVILKIFSKR